MAYRPLEVTVISAKDLSNVNLFSEMEVYAVAMIVGDERSKQRTPVDRDGGKNPTWNFTAKFNVFNEGQAVLHVVLKSERALGDREIGEVRLPIRELIDGWNRATAAGSSSGAGDEKKPATPPQFVSYQVRKNSGKAKGALSLSYKFGDPVSTATVHTPPHIPVMEAEGSKEDYGAFIQKFELNHPHPSSSEPPLRPLQGLTFAVKDIFDISGYVTGFGNPDWALTHEPATSMAPAFAAVLEAGATCVGKTVMDEMAYSINGENYFYGTPTNPCAPDRVPGGSSSGSAVAVAAGLVDFSLGTDTGGSVRVPAAYCGIFGFRPSHGIVSTSKVIPMAQSFDTVGWFAKDPSILTLVGGVLLPLPIRMMQQPSHIIIPEDCFHLLGSPRDQLSEILASSLESIYGNDIIRHQNLGEYIYNEVPSSRDIVSKISEKQVSTIPALGAVSYAMRSVQRFEFKANHVEWINKTKPNLGPGISERVSEALKATDEDTDSYTTLRTELQSALTSLLENYGVLAIPTVPGPPPKLNLDAAALEDFRAKAFCLLSIAGMSGFCQVTIPLGMHDNLPVSISLMARHGADHLLLNLANSLHGTLKEEASAAWKLNH